jgi:hypothetical protein
MRARLRLLGLLVSVVAVATGCTGTAHATFPPLGSTPGPAGNTTAAAANQVIGALAAVGLQAALTNRPYRPPEGPLLAAAPRTVLQVALPDDPGHGFIVVYSLIDAPGAEAAASDMAAYVSTGNGHIQFVANSHFVLRVIGSAVVFFAWSPDNAPDASTHLIEDALSSLGDPVPVPA